MSQLYDFDNSGNGGLTWDQMNGPQEKAAYLAALENQKAIKAQMDQAIQAQQGFNPTGGYNPSSWFNTGQQVADALQQYQDYNNQQNIPVETTPTKTGFESIVPTEESVKKALDYYNYMYNNDNVDKNTTNGVLDLLVRNLEQKALNNPMSTAKSINRKKPTYKNVINDFVEDPSLTTTLDQERANQIQFDYPVEPLSKQQVQGKLNLEPTNLFNADSILKNSDKMKAYNNYQNKNGYFTKESNKLITDKNNNTVVNKTTELTKEGENILSIFDKNISNIPYFKEIDDYVNKNLDKLSIEDILKLAFSALIEAKIEIPETKGTFIFGNKKY